MRTLFGPFSKRHHFKHEKNFLRMAFAILLIIFAMLLNSQKAQAACAGTTLQWSGGTNTKWNMNNNWNGTNFPDNAGENALIVGASRVPNSDLTTTVSCFELRSGTMNTTSGVTLTITGDYFKNLTVNSLSVASGSTWKVVMGGSAAQTLDNVDTLNYVTVSNSSTVTFSQPFQIRNTLSMTGSGTTLNINANLTLQDTTTPFTIPATTTVVVGSGATLTAQGGITVDGTLRVDAGGSIVFGNGKTLQVNSGGLVQLAGSSGNVANLDASSGGTFNFTVAGSLNSNYARISHMGTSGINI